MKIDALLWYVYGYENLKYTPYANMKNAPLLMAE
jgi:hypothetical protein